MSMLDMLNNCMAYTPQPTQADETTIMTQAQNELIDPIHGFEGFYNYMKSEPTYYGTTGYVGPYMSHHWESGTPMLRSLNEEFILPTNNKVDPNKIFNSDIQGLNAIAADQQKILKLFEGKLKEALTDKNKFGITEEDVLGIQAITAARTAIANIAKARIDVKKIIADLRIKQQQVDNSISGGNNGGLTGDSKGGTMMGTDVLDALFTANAMPMQTLPPEEYSTASVDSAANLLDSIVSTNPNIDNERRGVETYVVIGETASDTSFAMFDENNNQIMDPIGLPNAKIKNVDIESGIATDEYDRKYKIKKRGMETLD